ncbi:uncharacterized protein [Dysidea avara]|uniref:uncharacterized protein n=1 Tax=Dysidea avara TaxID=196820 RepID=UPI00331AD272
MTSKQILVLPFLASFLVCVYSQTATNRLSSTELILALQKNLCIDVTFAITNKCLNNTATPLEYSIIFKKRDAPKRCRKLVRRLTNRGANVTAMDCDKHTSHKVQTTMAVEQLQWACETRWAQTGLINITYEKKAGIDLCTDLAGKPSNPPTTPTTSAATLLPNCKDIPQPCAEDIEGFCRCVLPVTGDTPAPTQSASDNDGNNDNEITTKMTRSTIST